MLWWTSGLLISHLQELRGSLVRCCSAIPGAIQVDLPNQLLRGLVLGLHVGHSVEVERGQCDCLMPIGLCAHSPSPPVSAVACAGAGGKTLALAELMERTGTVVAGDIRAYKLDDLRKRARRAGFPNIMTRPWDGKKISGKQAANFDGVLVDAPCSCSGVWRRNPDGRWSTTAADVDAMAPIQREVLDHAAPAVRPGGVLVYATCSVFASENQAVVADFLASHPEFIPEAFENPLDGTPVEDGMLAIDGSADNSDSMFVARLRRR